ncbi:hypothetical protein GPECTOR_85g356 [Gonium pectorale]|uniref:Ricin B lectin domain-containing protein n=1 Tax=Gonium pectorale TaxID=33097 RepID=A0A150G178_GONPE|nr:hypothetical protein GPECTOR_85g356 [Gonium pectorale]|eukprot:KXZ43626.1 hypothetical protein GPECTOR_85g356 [Gonium pectorale]
MRLESTQGWGDDTAANSVVFTCSNQKGTDTNAHSGFWGSWTGWTYCPGNSYICGLQVRIESPGGDDTAFNGLRIACCGFPSDNSTAVISTGSIKTGTTTAQTSCLDITNNLQSVGTFIRQWACNTTAASQLLVITSTVTGAFTINAVPSNLCVTALNAGTSDGTRIVLDTCTGKPNQVWAVLPSGAGTYTLQPTHVNNKCLDVSASSTANGAVIQNFALNLPTRSTSGTIQTSTASNRCMDVVANNQAAGTYINQWECNNTGAQKFTITMAGTNAYQITSFGGFCVSIMNASTSSGARIVLATCVAGAKHQLFRASAGYQGGVALSPLHATGMCIDVNGASSSLGAVMQIYACNGGKAQALKLTLPA